MTPPVDVTICMRLSASYSKRWDEYGRKCKWQSLEKDSALKWGRVMLYGFVFLYLIYGGVPLKILIP
jgi:hypothetical protein